jgi:hypothetical protein
MITVAGAAYDALDTPLIIQRYDLMKPLFFAPATIGLNIIAKTDSSHDSVSIHYR